MAQPLMFMMMMMMIYIYKTKLASKERLWVTSNSSRVITSWNVK